jgi:SAM-dependent methyltransferase/uncharacterized membrane protein YbhN (UPF0104 family)
MRRIAVGLALTSIALGGVATAVWWRFGDAGAFAAVPAEILLSLLAGLVTLSMLNLSIRWVRWHFLTRRFIRTIPTVASLRLYFGTLIAFATPLYLGELIRTALAARGKPGGRQMIFWVWATERLADATILGLFLLLSQGRWQALAGLSVVAAGLVTGLRLGMHSRPIRALLKPRVVAVVGGTTLAAWSLAVFALWGVVRGLGESIPLASAAEVFSVASFLGAASLIPAGSGVTGSSMILHLGSVGVSPNSCLVAVGLFRAGSSWFALGLGGLALLRWRRQLGSIARADDSETHFDALAADYHEEIPEHIRDRLVARKAQAMDMWLRRQTDGRPLRGLDLGCGHGWYAVEMASRGYAMSACDRSTGQVAFACRSVAEQSAEIEVRVADAGSLPYPDASFDFAYSVNVFHHMRGPVEQQAALSEIVRVLKPGGVFFLQEINTANPLFTFYMDYVFPVLREIDDGTEYWIRPSGLPAVAGASWHAEKTYLTFLPDFIPRALLPTLGVFERALEHSPVRTWSAHYVARLRKHPATD